MGTGTLRPSTVAASKRGRLFSRHRCHACDVVLKGSTGFCFIRHPFPPTKNRSFEMSRQRVYVAGLVAIAGIALAGPVVAQNTGQVEIGGFGQYTRADYAWHVQSGYGLGGNAGVFLTRRIALEGDASFSTFQ